VQEPDAEGNLGATIGVKLARSAAPAIATEYVPLRGCGLEMCLSTVDDGSDHISASWNDRFGALATFRRLERISASHPIAEVRL
jgi:hypothetical protein